MAKAQLVQFKEDEGFREATFEGRKEAFANFLYYNALSDTI